MEEIRKKLEELEKEMASLNFWQDKEKALKEKPKLRLFAA